MKERFKTIKTKLKAALGQHRKVGELQLFLTVVFVAALLISNIITAKQIQAPFGITFTGGIFIFPITYILSDLFSEVYGYRWSRITCYIAFAMNLFMVIIFSIVIAMPAPSYWMNQEAFATVLGSAPRILGASLLAYIVGDFANDRIFRTMKKKHPDSMKGFGFRAITSSFLGQLTDSIIFLPLAFLGVMPLKVLLIMMVTEVILKTLYETLILPVTTILTRKTRNYEAKINLTA